MKQLPNLKYLLINIGLIALELVLLLLAYAKIIAFDYGWDGRMNRYFLITMICAQIGFLLFIANVKDLENQKRLYLGQLVLFFVTLLCLGSEVEWHYKIRYYEY